MDPFSSSNLRSLPIGNNQDYPDVHSRLPNAMSRDASLPWSKKWQVILEEEETPLTKTDDNRTQIQNRNLTSLGALLSKIRLRTGQNSPGKTGSLVYLGYLKYGKMSRSISGDNTITTVFSFHEPSHEVKNSTRTLQVSGDKISSDSFVTLSSTPDWNRDGSALTSRDDMRRSSSVITAKYVPPAQFNVTPQTDKSRQTLNATAHGSEMIGMTNPISVVRSALSAGLEHVQQTHFKSTVHGLDAIPINGLKLNETMVSRGKSLRIEPFSSPLGANHSEAHFPASTTNVTHQSPSLTNSPSGRHHIFIGRLVSLYFVL